MSSDPVKTPTGPESKTATETLHTRESFSPADEVAPERSEGPWWSSIKEPGSALQIIIAALLGIAIGLAVAMTVDSVPDAATDITSIPGVLWLRALKCVVLPLIVVSLIIAMQRLKVMQKEGPRLAWWTVGWYMGTTLLAIIISTILTDLVWAKRFYTVGAESLNVDEEQQAEIDETPTYTISETVVNLFESFVPQNIVQALADSELLSVLVASILVGLLLHPDGSIMKAVYEIERVVTILITWLIQAAPYGVFSLIMSNLFRLDIAEMGENLGFLIAGSVANFFIHLFIVLPVLFFAFTRENPFSFWLKCAPAWITAWGSASSAATLPVTMKCIRKQGVPNVVAKFAAPLGCLVNMDGTAIYFPICVTFLAETQGIHISAVNYVIVVLLSTLASIGTTPIPSSSLVLTVMIADSIDVPLTGMYAAVVAIDWLLDRFRTALNVTGDCYGSYVVTKMTGMTDENDGDAEFEAEVVERRDSRV